MRKFIYEDINLKTKDYYKICRNYDNTYSVYHTDIDGNSEYVGSFTEAAAYGLVREKCK